MPNSTAATTTLERVAGKLRELVADQQLAGADVTVYAKPLTPEEAIGTPGRRDFPISIGKERVIEATVHGSRGHAFTDSPRELVGSLESVLALELTTNPARAVFVATANALMHHLGKANATVHCRNQDPETCGKEIARELLAAHREKRVGLIGCNPAIADELVSAFGGEHISITDLDQDTVGTRISGVEVWDGRTRTNELLEGSDVVLVSGTTLVNGTFDPIRDRISELGKDWLVYGVTAAGVCALEGLPRICPRGRDR